MKDEPGIDLSNPAPEIMVPYPYDQFDQYKESIMEMLRDKVWVDCKVTATAGPTMPMQTFGSPLVDVITAGPGSCTFTITVSL